MSFITDLKDGVLRWTGITHVSPIGGSAEGDILITLKGQGMDQLDDRSKDIIQSRWLIDPKITLQELADKYGVSAERIRQLEAVAMKKLKAHFSA